MFKYRVKHDLVVVGDCMSGLHSLYTQPPDVILINALHFASEDYGFARALSEEPRHEGVGMVVLVSGAVGEIRSRAIEQFGATILELPANADELSEAISKAQGIRAWTSTPRPVIWGRADEKSRDATQQEETPTTVHRVSWQAFGPEETESEHENIRPVNWAVDGSGTEAPNPGGARPRRKTPSRQPAKRVQPKDEKLKHIPRDQSGEFRPASTPGGDGFRPIVDSAPKVEPEQEDEGPKLFKPSTLHGLSGVDPENVKNR
jgi:hypothetical protein